MKLLLLELAVWIRSFSAKPFHREPVQVHRFYLLAVVVLCLEFAIALWVMGAVRPLAPTW